MLKNTTLTLKTSEDVVEAFQPLIKTEHLRIFQVVCYGIVSQIFVVFGMVTNIINMICFVKQGFKEPINISLLGLAVSDFGSLLTIGWTNICMIPAFQERNDLPFDPLDTQHLISGMPHVILTRVTSCITAFITLERCLCITMPLKVARIFTPRRVSVIIISIFVFLCMTVSPIYYVGWYGMKYFPERNKSVIGLIFSEKITIVEQVSLAINSVIVPFSALAIILICMSVTVLKLRKQTKWRQENSGSSVTDTNYFRDQRVAKMVVTISVLFVVCFCPSVVIFLGTVIVPEFWYRKKYHNMIALSYGFSNVFESTNASMNIFIYYQMSSKYRACFRQTLCLLEKKS